MGDDWVLCLVTGRLGQKHWPSPTDHASRLQNQHALQQQQCMLDNRVSHGGLGLAHFSSGASGAKCIEETHLKRCKEKETDLGLNKGLFHI